MWSNMGENAQEKMKIRMNYVGNFSRDEDLSVFLFPEYRF